MFVEETATDQVGILRETWWDAKEEGWVGAVEWLAGMSQESDTVEYLWRRRGRKMLGLEGRTVCGACETKWISIWCGKCGKWYHSKCIPGLDWKNTTVIWCPPCLEEVKQKET